MFRRKDLVSRKAMGLVALPFVIITLMLGGLLLSATPASTKAFDFADPAFLVQWQRADKPVQDGSAGGRSWVWGPAFSEGKIEAYAESPNNKRLVQYFDKARMEINNPNAARTDKFYVTNGLLVTDMIKGQAQTGDSTFAPSETGPAIIPVAGDPEGNTVALTYASFKPVASLDGNNRAPNQTGQAANLTLSKDGVAGQNPATAGYGVTFAYYDNNLGHNIPNVFWSFLNKQGSVYLNGSLSNGLILEWEVAAGYPLTEAYWSRAVVGGQEKDVLVQMFQRRVLTYTPSNDEAFRVEMGNVGQHYYKWRYTQPAPTPTPTPTAVPPTPTPAPTTAIPGTPAPAQWSSPREAQSVAKPIIRIRPTDGEIWIAGENKGQGGIFASSSGSDFKNVLNLKPGSSGEKVDATFDSSGNLHVVWQEGTDVGLQTHYARINAGSKQDWLRNMGKELNNNIACGLAAIYFNPTNKRLYLLHEENPGNLVLYESSDEGKTWGSRYVVVANNGTATNARIVGDAQGNLHITWTRKVQENELFSTSRFGDTWTPPYNITQYNGSWNSPPGSLAVAANGDLYATWISPGNNSAGIGFARYDAATKKWQPRRDNISNTSQGYGTFKTSRITTTSNGSIWIGFSLDNPNVSNRSGGYYMVSTDGGANWSEVRPIFRRDSADAADIFGFGSNVYFVGLYNRQTLYSVRGQ